MKHSLHTPPVIEKTRRVSEPCSRFLLVFIQFVTSFECFVFMALSVRIKNPYIEKCLLSMTQKPSCVDISSMESCHCLMCKTNAFHNRLYVLLSFTYVLFSFGYALFSFGYVFFSFHYVLFPLFTLFVCSFYALFVFALFMCSFYELFLCAFCIRSLYVLFLCTLFMCSFSCSCLMLYDSALRLFHHCIVCKYCCTTHPHASNEPKECASNPQKAKERRNRKKKPLVKSGAAIELSVNNLVLQLFKIK